MGVRVEDTAALRRQLAALQAENAALTESRQARYDAGVAKGYEAGFAAGLASQPERDRYVAEHVKALEERLAAAEAVCVAAERVFGGPLCISKSPRMFARLREALKTWRAAR